MEMNLENLNKILNNNQNTYYGHGTSGDNKIISIFNNGLRCSHGEMYYTTCALGKGGELDDAVFNQMNDWPHKPSDKIVIISLPIKYNILGTLSLGTTTLESNAFCYDVVDEGRQGKYVMPEFIVGCYDAKTKTFEQNSKYYELLPEEEQEKLFERVKENYAKTIEDACGLAYYKEVIESLPQWEFPLTDEECTSLIEESRGIMPSIEGVALGFSVEPILEGAKKWNSITREILDSVEQGRLEDGPSVLFAYQVAARMSASNFPPLEFDEEMVAHLEQSDGAHVQTGNIRQFDSAQWAGIEIVKNLSIAYDNALNGGLQTPKTM